jgi:wyosine [tRNA(Phe)-imidazoG37] synthetase (radical SAM superfamily)
LVFFNLRNLRLLIIFILCKPYLINRIISVNYLIKSFQEKLLPMIFGPVHSRRLGLSLGVDLLPPIKTCTFNCRYCEIGPTQMMGFVGIDTSVEFGKQEIQILDMILSRVLRETPELDSITLGYNGEPTLVQNLDEVIEAIKKIRKKTNSTVSISLFTNSSTISDRNVRERISHADRVIAKLDAAVQRTYEIVNVPHSSVPPIENIIKVEDLEQEVKERDKKLKEKDDEIKKIKHISEEIIKEKDEEIKQLKDILKKSKNNN